jgi:hypothetical protein
MLCYVIHLLTLLSRLFEGRIGGAGGLPGWSPIQVLSLTSRGVTTAPADPAMQGGPQGLGGPFELKKKNFTIILL